MMALPCQRACAVYAYLFLPSLPATNSTAPFYAAPFDDIVPYSSGCAWTVLARSPAACPLECPVVVTGGGRLGRWLCAHNGICGECR